MEHWALYNKQGNILHETWDHSIPEVDNMRHWKKTGEGYPKNIRCGGRV